MEENSNLPQVVQYPADCLKNALESFDFDNPPTDPIELAHTLTKAMIAGGGIGLAANQLGLPYRVFVIKSNPVICCFNPRIVDIGEESETMIEGCLSFEGEYVKVKRPRRVKVRFTRPNGEIVTERFVDLTARVFQHELDHLDGITMLDRASYLERERFYKRRKQLSRRKKNSQRI